METKLNNKMYTLYVKTHLINEEELNPLKESWDAKYWAVVSPLLVAVRYTLAI